MSVYPENIERTTDRSLKLTWSDGTTQTLAYRVLRDSCPCAACRAPKTGSAPETSGDGLRILTAAETMPLEILKMTPVGNYAYHIQFSDGHETGIFTYELLRRLGDTQTSV